MNDPEKNSQRDHWQAIADQLGLSSEPEATERPREEPLARTPAAPVPIEKTFSRQEDPEPQAPDRELDHEARLESPVLQHEELPSDDSDSARDSDRPRRGGRRRGPKSELGAEAGEGRAPRKGRGRKAPRQEESVPDDEEPPTEPQAPTESPEDDDDEIPRMSEWNVPSWNDLISSLYRPDR